MCLFLKKMLNLTFSHKICQKKELFVEKLNSFDRIGTLHLLEIYRLISSCRAMSSDIVAEYMVVFPDGLR